MPNKYGKGYGSNNRVTSRTPAPLDEGGVRPSDSRKPNGTPPIGDSRDPSSLSGIYRRVTSRTGNQIPNPVEEQNQRGSTRAAAQSKLIEAAKKRVGAKIPMGDELVATKGVRTAAAQRMAQAKKGK